MMRIPLLLRLMACAVISASSGVCTVALGQDYLPTDDEVGRALREQPEVRAAVARVDAADGVRRALVVGSHEFEANVGTQSRRIADEGRRYEEWEAQVSHAIRLPAKARLDRQIGERTRDVADLRLVAAERLAARRLLEAWMGWLRSAAVAEESAAQEALLGREKAALSRRVASGDAAERELDLMEAERAGLAAQTVLAQDAALVARHALVSGFPQIQVPVRPPGLPDPQPLPGDASSWREQILRENPEIGIATAEAERLARVAERTRADRTPDPTLGVRVLSDLGGAERAVGLVFTVPLGTSYRSAMAAAESANAVAAELDAIGMRRVAEQSAWVTVQAAHSRFQHWQSSRQALSAQETASARTRRAWELGEASLAEHLIAQRNLLQVRLSEAEARVDALQAQLLVRIDAHELWQLVR